MRPRSRTSFCAFVLLFVVTAAQKCEEKNFGFSSFRSATTCTGIVDKFPEVKHLSFPLTCVNCIIPVLDETTIPNFRGDMFNLSYSQLRVIKDDAFSTFWPTVKKFRLNNNELFDLAPGLFHNFTGLVEINFSANNLSKLSPLVFDGVTTELLDLSQNHLTEIQQVFHGVGVSKLNISYNALTEIPPETFKALTMKKIANYVFFTERSILLSNNKIGKIHEGSFKVQGDFDILDLGFNEIEIIENNTFAGLNLKHLDLQKNRISVLNTKSFAGLKVLRRLVVSFNEIQELPVGLFADLHYLESLRLDSNKIKQMGPTTFSGMPSLRFLNVSNNHIKIVTDSVLVPLGSIYELDISYNRLKTFDLNSVLEHNNKLRNLHINHNFWQCTELVAMYKMMVKKSGTLELSATDFNVPNLHGIPCSRIPFSITDDMTFEEFLKAISQDMVLEDLYNVKLDPLRTTEEASSSYLQSIFYLVLLITIIYVFSAANFCFKNICFFLQKRNIVSKNFTILYNNESDVRLV